MTRQEHIKHLEVDGWGLGVCDAGLGSANLMSVTRNLLESATVQMSGVDNQGKKRRDGASFRTR